MQVRFSQSLWVHLERLELDRLRQGVVKVEILFYLLHLLVRRHLIP